MRNRLLSIGVAAGCVLLAAPELDACGDKLLRMGRAMRNPRAPIPASILLYVQPGSGTRAAADDLKLSTTLNQAGHRFRTVEREADLQAALRSGGYDIVLGDASASSLVEGANHGSSKPRFVPVFYKPSKQQLAAAEKQNICFVAAPAKRFEVLAEIDHIMKERRKLATSGL